MAYLSRVENKKNSLETLPPDSRTRVPGVGGKTQLSAAKFGKRAVLKG
jgi:hypothetical protein